jgi:GT2 family glycosyltransferase
MKVFVIVVTYNGAKWLEKCFDSLKKSSIPLYILAIDNASSDNTVSQIRNHFPEVEIVETGSNLGFGKANNIGLKKAIEQNADYIFLLNQDAWVEEVTIERLVEIASKNPEYGIISPFHLNYDGSKVETYFNDFVLNYYTPGYKNDKLKSQVRNLYLTQFVHAACWLISVETIKLVGGFDPLFFHYGEDNDYVQRLLFKNKFIGIVPNTIVHHNGQNEGLKNPEKNLDFLIIQVLIQLKNPTASTLGALALFFKHFIQALIKSSENNISYLAYKANFQRLFEILESRKTQRKSLAYLK